MKHIIPFKLFEQSESENAQKLENLKFLQELGLITAIEAKRLRAEVYAGHPEEFLNEPGMVEVFNSPEFRSLQEIGYSLDSTLRQLLNGTIVLRLGENPYRLGIFTETKKIRRLMPPNPNLRNVQDQTITSFPGLEGADLYVTAFAWIRDNIDHTTAELETVRTVTSRANVIAKKENIISKLTEVLTKIGLDNSSISEIAGSIPEYLTIAEHNDILKLTKNLYKQGILYLPKWVVETRRPSLERVIVGNNIKWTSNFNWMRLSNDFGMFETCTAQFDAIGSDTNLPESNTQNDIHISNMKLTQRRAETLEQISNKVDERFGNNVLRISIANCSIRDSIKLPYVNSIQMLDVASTFEIELEPGLKYMSVGRLSGEGSINIIAQNSFRITSNSTSYGWLNSHISINGNPLVEFIHDTAENQFSGTITYDISLSSDGAITQVLVKRF